MFSCVHIFLLFFTWRFSECTVNVTAVPETIQVGVTTALTLTCTVTIGTQFRVTSIHIYHSASEGHNFTDLAIIDANEKITSKNPYITNISGYVNSSQTSYLSLTWAYPTSSLAGRYLCNVSIIDLHFHHSYENGNYTVSAVKPDFEDVIKELEQTRSDVEKKSYSDQWKRYVENFTNFYFTDVQVPVSGSPKYLLSKQLNTSVMQADIMCHLLGGYLAELNPSEKSHVIEVLNGTFFTAEIFTTGSSTATTNTDTQVTSVDTTPVDTTADTSPVDTTADTSPVYTTADTTPDDTTVDTTTTSASLYTRPADLVIIGGSDVDGAGDWVYMRNNQTVQFNVALTPSPSKDCLALDVNDNFNVVAVPCSDPNRDGTSTYICQLPN